MPAAENILTYTDDFIKWFLPKIEKFPRNYKFLIGDRIVTTELNLLERLIEAYFRWPVLRRPARQEVARFENRKESSRQSDFSIFPNWARGVLPVCGSWQSGPGGGFPTAGRQSNFPCETIEARRAP